MRPGIAASRSLALQLIQLIQSIPKATTRRLVTFNNEVRRHRLAVEVRNRDVRVRHRTSYETRASQPR